LDASLDINSEFWFSICADPIHDDVILSVQEGEAVPMPTPLTCGCPNTAPNGRRWLLTAPAPSPPPAAPPPPDTCGALVFAVSRGAVSGEAAGAAAGNRAARPVGAIVGGAIGTSIGTVTGTTNMLSGGAPASGCAHGYHYYNGYCYPNR
jgi:hypothetical protein